MSRTRAVIAAVLIALASMAMAQDPVDTLLNSKEAWDEAFLTSAPGSTDVPQVYYTYLPAEEGPGSDGSMFVFVRVDTSDGKDTLHPDLTWYRDNKADASTEPIDTPDPVQLAKNAYQMSSPTANTDDPENKPALHSVQVYKYRIHPIKAISDPVVLHFSLIKLKADYRMKVPMLSTAFLRHALTVESVHPEPVPISATSPKSVTVRVSNPSPSYALTVTDYEVSDTAGIISESTKKHIQSPVVIAPAGDQDATTGEFQIEGLKGDWDGIIRAEGERPKLLVTLFFDVSYRGHTFGRGQEVKVARPIVYVIDYPFIVGLLALLCGTVLGVYVKKSFAPEALNDPFLRASMKASVLAGIVFLFCILLRVEVFAGYNVRILSFFNPFATLVFGALVGIDPRRFYEALTKKQDPAPATGANP